MSLTSYRTAPPRVQRTDDRRQKEGLCRVSGRVRGVVMLRARRAGRQARPLLSSVVCPLSSVPWRRRRGRPVDLAATYSPTPRGVVPSALRGFTAEFGMGSGGPPALWPPGRRDARSRGQGTGDRGQGTGDRRTELRETPHPSSGFCPLSSDCGMGGAAASGDGRQWSSTACCCPLSSVVCPPTPAPLVPGRGRSIERLGPVGCTCRHASTPGLSTWWSPTALGETWSRGGFPA
jgi:hypothetical protein